MEKLEPWTNRLQLRLEACASFGKVSFLKVSLDSDQYARLLDEQLIIFAKLLGFVITKKGEIDDQFIPMQFKASIFV
ncbi:hypothetical protein Taro_002343 [Colocasia esculenta]|uniref:Uncharacterized protein n=1 Tax=Colocasia esculenta TaxID=4460 RepID=A0A843TKM0_COLES|nr:hypothetical protein [Colocasia esculenta]